MIRAFFVPSLLLALWQPVCAQPTPKPGTAANPTAGIAERIDAYTAPLQRADHLSGTLLVARGDAVLYHRSWGLADRDLQRPFTQQTPSAIASVTKPITIILASHLLDQGALALDDPIAKWIPSFPRGEQITVRHLLFHRSGIPHRIAAAADETIARTPSDMVALASQGELDFDPGSRRSYSSGGYIVLSRVMELAGGKSYEQLLNDVILQPLQLKGTFHAGPGVDLVAAAQSYCWTAAGLRPAPAKDYSFLVGAGAIFSTPADLFAIARATIDGQFGVRAKNNVLRFGQLRWNGFTNHYRAFLDYDTKSDVIVCMVTNQMVGASDWIRQAVPRIVAGEEVQAPQVPSPTIVSLSDEKLESYAGVYDIGGPMPVRARDGALYANDWALLPISESSFFSPQDYATVEVVLVQDKPVALRWGDQDCQRLRSLDRAISGSN